VWQNTSLNQDTICKYAEEAGGFNSTTWKREYLCQWVTDSEYALTPEFASSKGTVIEETPRPDLRELFHNYAALDIGTRDKTALLFGYYDFPRATLVIEDEWVPERPSEITTEILASAVREKERTLWAGQKSYRRVSDNNNLLLIQDLGTIHGLPFIPTSKDSLHAMVNEVRLWLAAGRLRVNPRCRQLIGCLEFGIWDKHRREFDRSSLYGHFDAFAALMYLIRNVDTHTNPIPANYGVNPLTHYISARSPKGEALAAKLFPGLNKNNSTRKGRTFS